MTANEMRYEFMVVYDKITNQAAPGYTDAEVSVFWSGTADELCINSGRSTQRPSRTKKPWQVSTDCRVIGP